MGKKNKKAKTAVSLVLPSKKPSAEPVRDFNELYPAWRISQLEVRDPFGWHELDKGTLDSIRQRLKSLESMTWKEILVDHNHWNHTVAQSSLSKPARDRLVELDLDDQEFFVSLRLTQKERIWGFRSMDSLMLLWWDPNHDVWGG